AGAVSTHFCGGPGDTRKYAYPGPNTCAVAPAPGPTQTAVSALTPSPRGTGRRRSRHGGQASGRSGSRSRGYGDEFELRGTPGLLGEDGRGGGGRLPLPVYQLLC